MLKRCFNTQEAMDYLGVKRRFFETTLAPALAGKGIRAGTSIVYEKCDLDAAWEKYKIIAGSERPGNQGEKTWDVQEHQASTRRAMAATRSMPGTKAGAFASAVSKLSPKLKAI